MSDKLDLVLFGATGFTGGLAVQYLLENYGQNIKWAIAGRSKARLEAKLAKYGHDSSLTYPKIIVADSFNKESLVAMVEQTAVVATTAGPFARYGTLLVEACAETGTDYCDITGELDWVREMIATYDDQARANGARIVSLCGHDSIPWDLSTYLLAKELKEEHHTDLARVDYYDHIRSAPSGGTLETAFGIMFGSEKKMKKSEAQKAMGFDPLVKRIDGTKSESATKARNITSIQRASKGVANLHRTMFFMAGVNAGSVKRSNALNGYGKNVVYCEGQSFKKLYKGVLYLLGLAVFGLCLFIPPLRFLLRKFVLPAPGQGPSDASMEKGFLHVLGVARGENGKVIKSTMSFNVDPGYKDTARMLVESALSLSLGKVTSKGGVLTPGACQKDVLVERLLKTGTKFAFH